MPSCCAATVKLRPPPTARKVRRRTGSYMRCPFGAGPFDEPIADIEAHHRAQWVVVRTVEPFMSYAVHLPARIRPAFSGFAPLSVPNYRRFAGSNVLAMSATWMQRIAQDWLV